MLRMKKVLSLGIVVFFVSALFAQSSVLRNENYNFVEIGSQYTKYGDIMLKQQPNTRSVTRSTVLYQDFSSTTFPPSGWTTINGTQSAGAQHWNRAENLSVGDPETTIEGQYAFVNWTNGSGASNQDEWLITPQINIPANAFLRFDFYTLFRYMVAGVGSNAGDGNNGDFNVKISTDNGTSWTTIWNEDTCYNAGGLVSGNWNNVSVSLAEYAGQPVKIAFQYTGYDACWLVLDNVVVDTLIAQDYELTDARVNFNSKYVNYGYNGNFSHFPRREITSDSKVCFEGVATNYGIEDVTVNLVAKVYNPNDEQIFSYTFSSVTVPAATYVNGVYQPSVDTIVYYTESSTPGSYQLIQASLFSMSNMTIDGTYRFEVSLQPASGTYSNPNNRNLSVNRYSTISDDCLYSRDNGNYTQGSYFESCNPQWHNFTAFGTTYQIYSTSDAINSVEAYICSATNGATFHYEIFRENDDETYTSVFSTESYTVNSSTFTPGFVKLFSENPLTFTNMSLDFQKIIVAVVVENNKRIRVGIDETVQPCALENKAFDGTDWYWINGTEGFLMIRTYVCEQGSYITVASENPDHGTTTGSGRYDNGSTATISAVPNEGFRFLSWTDGNTDNPRNVIVEQDATYTATFEAIPTFTITAVSNNDSFGTVTGGGTYYEGTVVRITATPISGYAFIGWNDGSATNPRDITVTQNVMLIATFAEITTVNITAVSANEDFGTVTGGGPHEIGTTVTLIAYPNPGYVFDSWNDSNTDNPRQFVATTDAMYIATFVPQSGVSEASENTIAIYPNPAGDMLNISSNGQMSKVEFVSITGQVLNVIDINTDNAAFDVSNFANGMYFVKIYGTDGSISQSKFVKE